MRRLELLPCPESWDRMRADGDGRYCERCRLRVTDVTRLDEAGLDSLLADADGGRVCARFELDGGRPVTKLGLAAGVVVVTLAGCANPELADKESALDKAADLEYVESDSGDENDGKALIAGAVRHEDGYPLAGAIVILQSVSLDGQRERVTNEHGVYKFENLPPGNYTIQVLYGAANVSKITALPEAARFRANFKLNPERAHEVFVGMVVEKSMIDTTSASSTYSSALIEYD